MSNNAREYDCKFFFRDLFLYFYCMFLCMFTMGCGRWDDYWCKQMKVYCAAPTFGKAQRTNMPLYYLQKSTNLMFFGKFCFEHMPEKWFIFIFNLWRKKYNNLSVLVHFWGINSAHNEPLITKIRGYVLNSIEK